VDIDESELEEYCKDSSFNQSEDNLVAELESMYVPDKPLPTNEGI
jgi:hypothetical protein